MKKLILFIALISLFSAAYGQETITESMSHDGIERTYMLYIPASYEPGNPLILNFHGYTSSALEQLFYGDFRSIADEAGFLLAVPQGTEDNMGTTHWNVGWGASTVDDVGFVSSLIDTLYSNYAINLERVYSTGMSNGGFLSYVLACELSERIAAIASVTGTMNLGSFNTCDAQHPMPVMEIHGTADGTVTYEGAFWIEGSEDVVAYWANFNSITTAPTVTQLEDIDPNDGCTAEHWVYENGSNGAEVELYKITDGGHTWPGADFNIGVTNNDFDASTEIWRFFSQYDINGLITPNGIEEDQNTDLGLYPNPAHAHIQFVWNKAEAPYTITDMQGKLVSEGTVRPGANSISVAALLTGVYQITVKERTQTFSVE